MKLISETYQIEASSLSDAIANVIAKLEKPLNYNIEFNGISLYSGGYGSDSYTLYNFTVTII